MKAAKRKARDEEDVEVEEEVEQMLKSQGLERRSGKETRWKREGSTEMSSRPDDKKAKEPSKWEQQEEAWREENKELTSHIVNDLGCSFSAKQENPTTEFESVTTDDGEKLQVYVSGVFHLRVWNEQTSFSYEVSEWYSDSKCVLLTTGKGWVAAKSHERCKEEKLNALLNKFKELNYKGKK